MKRDKAYTALAGWFEYLNDDCGYEQWSQYLISRIGRFSVRSGLDIGCGSGRFTRDFRRAGYEMTGLDVSEAMLTKAEALARKEKISVKWRLGDIARFRSPEKFDFAISVNDCFNYIPKEKLPAAFGNVRSALHKKGVFLFDVSSPRKFREKIADTVCADDREEVTYLSFNSADGDKVTMDVTLFVRRADGAFDRFDERHVQYVHEPEFLRGELEKSGFEVLEEEGFLGEKEQDSDRICFLARRK